MASMADDMRFAAAFPTIALEDRRSALTDREVAPVASGMASLMPRGLVNGRRLRLDESIADFGATSRKLLRQAEPR